MQYLYTSFSSAGLQSPSRIMHGGEVFPAHPLSSEARRRLSVERIPAENYFARQPDHHRHSEHRALFVPRHLDRAPTSSSVQGTEVSFPQFSGLFFLPVLKPEIVFHPKKLFQLLHPSSCSSKAAGLHKSWYPTIRDMST